MVGATTPASLPTASTSTASSPASAIPSFSAAYLAEDRSFILMDTCIALFIIMTVAVAMRIASRRIAWAGWMWGDFFISLSYLLMIGMIVLSILCIQNGAGKHLIVLPANQLIQFLLLTHYYMPVVYAFASILPKLAILEVYIRFFVLDRIPRYLSYLCAAIMVINTIVNIPFIIAQCAPVAFLWDRTIPGGYCNNAQQHFLWGGIANVLTDVIMMILPMPLVWKLQSSRQVKWGIFTTFLVGSIGLIFSILRFVNFDVSYEDDGTFISATVIMFGLIEPGVYLIAACFLTYRPLFRWLSHTALLAPIRSRLSSKLSKHSESGNSSALTIGDTGFAAARDGRWHRLEPMGRDGSRDRGDEESQTRAKDAGRVSQIGMAVPMPAPGATVEATETGKSGISVVAKGREEDDDEGEGLSFEEMMRAGPRR